MSLFWQYEAHISFAEIIAANHRKKYGDCLVLVKISAIIYANIAISDMCLARADGISERFYSMSASIEKERKTYYTKLESCQKGELDITSWLIWFLSCLGRAIENANKILGEVLHKDNLWRKLSSYSINERQRKIINMLLDDF